MKKDMVLHTYIVFMLGQKHISQASIATAVGMTPAMVNYVIMGKRRCKEIEAVILKIMDCPSWEHLKSDAHRFQKKMVEVCINVG